MQLFNINGDKIEVYGLFPKSEKIKLYKMQEMEKINDDERVMRARTNYHRPLESPELSVFLRYLNQDKDDNFGENFWHKFEHSGKRRQEMVLNNYYEGKFDKESSNLVRVIDDCTNQIIKYLLLTNLRYHFYESGGEITTMPDIIEVPESLYLLHLIMQERFSLVTDKNIIEQLNCFDLTDNPSESFDIKKVEEMCKLGLIEENFDSIIERVKVRQKILEIKKSQT